MSGETLKPCPWCGGEAEISQIGNEHTKSRGFEVKCKTWGCSTVKRALVVRHTMAEARLFAVERWNTRPTPTVEGGETQPVAWRVKDFADDWVLCRLEGGARQAVQDGFHVEPLYSADALASRDAEIERLKAGRALADDLAGQYLAQRDAAEAERDRLSAALGEAERELEIGLKAAGSKELLESFVRRTLSTLKTARERKE